MLGALIRLPQDSGHTLVAVVSQPARPAGRKNLLADPPVAQYVKDNRLAIPLFQPESARAEPFLDELRSLEPDLIMTAAYGQILSEKFLKIPKRATINFHPSLLPRYRGATPVQSALLAGDHATGISILFTVRALDAGAIIFAVSSPIDQAETTGVLMPRLFQLGAEALPTVLEKLEDPDFIGTPQDESKISHCTKIQKADGLLNWTQSAATLVNRFRAFAPWPGSFTYFNKKRLVVTQMSLSTQTVAPNQDAGSFVFNKSYRAIEVRCGHGSVLIHRVKPEGGKDQDAAGFWNGLKLTQEGKFDGPA